MLEAYYANAKFNSDCGDYEAAVVALRRYCEITQTPGVPGSGPNGVNALWGRLACEVYPIVRSSVDVRRSIYHENIMLGVGVSRSGRFQYSVSFHVAGRKSQS